MLKLADHEVAEALRAQNFPVNRLTIAVHKAGQMYNEREKNKTLNEHNWGND